VSEVPLPSPAFTSWPTFPFEGDLRVKKLDDPVDVEPPRHGEDPSECSACRAPDHAYIWVSERWRVRSLEQPTGLPMVLILESRSHLDLGDLPNLLAAELGVLTVRLERAIRSLDGVARVHVNRWGDGSAHLHVWFLARPYGRLQLRGTFLSLWDEILPRIPEDHWRANLAMVAEWLAEFGGRSLAEPPRIDWQAPALFAPTPSVDDSGVEDLGVEDLGAEEADVTGPGRLETPSAADAATEEETAESEAHANGAKRAADAADRAADAADAADRAGDAADAADRAADAADRPGAVSDDRSDPDNDGAASAVPAAGTGSAGRRSGAAKADAAATSVGAPAPRKSSGEVLATRVGAEQ